MLIINEIQTESLSRAEGMSMDNRMSSSELCEGVGIAVDIDSLRITFISGALFLRYSNKINTADTSAGCKMNKTAFTQRPTDMFIITIANNMLLFQINSNCQKITLL